MIYPTTRSITPPLTQSSVAINSLPPARVPAPFLYRYLVVHVVHARAVGRGRPGRSVRGRQVRRRVHFHRVGHFQRAHERHRPPARVARARGLPVHLRALGRVDGHAHSRVIRPVLERRLLRALERLLLHGTGRVRAVQVEAVRGRGVAGGVVLPHVHAPLRRVRELADVVDRVAGIGELRLLADELALGQEAALGAAVGRGALLRLLLEVVLVLGGRLMAGRDADEVGAARLRGRARVGSAE